MVCSYCHNKFGAARTLEKLYGLTQLGNAIVMQIYSRSIFFSCSEYIFLNNTGKACFRMDLSESPKAWTRIADLPVALSYFGFVFVELVSQY